MAHIQIPEVSPRIQYTADGVETIFTYPFPIFESTDIEVYVGDTLQVAGYSVTGVGVTAGGTVVFTAAPADQALITLLRNVPTERTTDFQTSGAFRADTVNDELDAIYAIMQQIEELQTRSLTLDETSSASISLELPDPTARRALVWNASADALINTTYDPDDALLLATQAAADAATAATSASDAQTAAEAAEAAAAAAGSVSILASTTILADGVDEYLLPMQVPSAVNVEVNIEGARLSPDGSTYEITDTLGVGQTLKLISGVATSPTGLQWAAGLKMDMITRVGGVSTGDLNNGSITTAKLADGAITTVKIAADAVDGTKIADNAIGNEHLTDDCVTVVEIAANAVDTAQVVDGAITAAKIAGGVLPTITTGTTTAQAWTNGGTITVAHGAAAAPDDVFIDVVCTSAEHGYSIGDVLRIASGVSVLSGVSWGQQIRWDATNVLFTVGLSGITVVALSPLGSLRTLTASNWQVRFPWRLY